MSDCGGVIRRSPVSERHLGMEPCFGGQNAAVGAGLAAAAYCRRDVITVLDDSHGKVGRQTAPHFLSPPPSFGSSANEKCHPELPPGQAPGEGMASSEHFLLLLRWNVWESLCSLGLKAFVSDRNKTPARGRRHANPLLLLPLSNVAKDLKLLLCGARNPRTSSAASAGQRGCRVQEHDSNGSRFHHFNDRLSPARAQWINTSATSMGINKGGYSGAWGRQTPHSCA